QIRQAPLFSHPHVCVVREDHSVIKEELTTEQYLDLRHIHISSRKGGLGHVDLALGKKGKRRHIALRTQNYLATPELISRTDLAITVPRVFADFMITQYPVRYMELPFDVPNLETYLYWHESTDKDQANRWMRELMLALPEKFSRRKSES
ncbi:MAG: LysR substrate-binding domain-containing protein, partial [Pseudomonadales bacterium]